MAPKLLKNSTDSNKKKCSNLNKLRLKLSRNLGIKNVSMWKDEKVKILLNKDAINLKDDNLFRNIYLDPTYKAYQHTKSNIIFITNFEDESKLPDVPQIEEIIMDKWIYGIAYAPIGSVMPVSIESLRQLNQKGKILAYKYEIIYICGSACIFYGVVPVVKTSLVSTIPFKACEVILPRMPVIELLMIGLCGCSEGCYKAKVRLYDYEYKICCSKRIPWKNIMVICGDYIDYNDDEDCLISANKILDRNCLKCASCSKCGFAKKYCSRHRKCKHKERSIPKSTIDKILAGSKTLNPLSEYLSTLP